ncbi:hypothetical protein ACFL6C_07690, partial [Myxococcota bacterium]
SGENTYLRARTFGTSGTADGDDFRLTSQTTISEGTHSIAVAADGSFVSAWEVSTEILAQRFTPTGNPQGVEIHVQPSHPGETTLAWLSDGGFFVAWSEGDDVDGDSMGVLGRRYASDGSPHADAFVVNQYTPGQQRLGNVVAHEDGVVIVWRSEETGNNSIRARLIPVLP